LELQQLEVQQLVARNRELELQLKVHTLAQATLRVAEAEGARWCAPRLSVYKCRRCPLSCTRSAGAAITRFRAIVRCVRGPGHERAYRPPTVV
jgi:hypothetical protein